ncbi:alpha/beta hydrolase [Streptomyces sp. TR1341]|uniref:alpha/beta fold hydrolase n=1 Tax=Streptomyces TaxID=1883 RepID=UPI00138AB3FB|nr:MULTISPECIES: alpha/beta hydrolase [Streptomyces]NDK29590.1 alpha/beta hydrolase [Streptomyces sp. TR1341]
MTTYVLVPGMWVGGWAWRDVTDRLRAAGHDVYPVTLTGLGERTHLGGVGTGLDTHITDVVNVILHEDLRDVVLVGHSYAGTVLPGVADRVPDRIATQVYVDSAPTAAGESHFGIHPAEAIEGMAGHVREHGDGWRLPAPDFAEMAAHPGGEGLTGEQCRLIQPRTSDHPFATVTEPLALTGSDTSAHRRIVIACNEFRGLAEAGIGRYQQAAAALEVHHLATGHWPMFTAPQELADLLDSAAKA